MKKLMSIVISVVAIMCLLAVFSLFSGCGISQDNQQIQATGTIEMTETTISTKVGGKVVQIPVEEGRGVKSGDLLAELDHAELNAQITAAKANLDLAKLLYQKSAKAINLNPNSADDSREAQIAAAQNNLAVAKANLDDASRTFDRMQKLYQSQLISQADYDKATTGKSVAQSQYQAALNNLTLAKSSPNTQDIDTTNKQSTTQIKQAESSLALLEIQLNNTKITASASGIVSAKLVEVGELVSPGSSLFTILDYSKPWVKIYLTLNEVERVSLNQKAYVKLDAYPDKKFGGRISFISNEAEFTPKDFLSKEERVKQVFAVKIELGNKEGLLKAGLPVDVWVEDRQ
jgi:HlyD family secretion protein